MKKLILMLAVLAVAGCVVVGEFPKNREKLHEMGHEQDYCQKNPDRCVEGVAW